MFTGCCFFFVDKLFYGKHIESSSKIALVFGFIKKNIEERDEVNGTKMLMNLMRNGAAWWKTMSSDI